MAKFQKGQSGNPKGRPKGSTNDKTKYIKEWAISLIGSNAKKLSDEFKLLPLKERWKVVSQLMPYVLPKKIYTARPKNTPWNTKFARH